MKLRNLFFALGLCLPAASLAMLGAGIDRSQALALLESPDVEDRLAGMSALRAEEEPFWKDDMGEALPILLGRLTAKGEILEIRRFAAHSVYLAATTAGGSEQVKAGADQAVAAANARLIADAAPAIIGHLDDAELEVRLDALRTVQVVTPRPPPGAREALTARLEEADPELVSVAVAALARMRPATDEVLDAVTAAARRAGPARPWAVRALGSLFAPDAGALATAASRLESADDQVRLEAIDALSAAQDGREAEVAAGLLAPLLEDREASSEVRSAARAAHDALAARTTLGPTAGRTAALEVLTAALAARDPEVRAAAAWSLGALAPLSGETSSALEAISLDTAESAAVRAHARNALDRLAGGS